MNYELFMGEALAEAKLALDKGERPVAAVAVVDEAMVARGHDRVQETDDPTAHAVVVALRETSRKLGPHPAGRRDDLRHPRAVRDVRRGPAASDVEALVFAMPNIREGAAGSVIQLAQHASMPRQIKIVSGIRRDEADALFETVPAR